MTTGDDDAIGSVTWPDGGTVATLRVDGSWSVPGSEWMESCLKLALSDDYQGPQDGPFGPKALADLAEQVGGTATVRPMDDPRSDDGEEVLY